MGEMRKLPDSMSASFVESLYQDYLRDPDSVAADWKHYFQGLAGTQGNGSRPTDPKDAILQERVDQLIRNYRVRGHTIARVDPLDVPRFRAPELDPEFWGFTEADMERRFSCESMCAGERLTL